MMTWHNNSPGMNPKRYDCGHCGQRVSSSVGFFSKDPQLFIYICTDCAQPTYFGLSGVTVSGKKSPERQVPGPRPGGEVLHLPDNIRALYKEARDCVAASAHTAAVLTCRKLLMHIGVEQGAKENQSFASYVDHLVTKGYAPPGSEGWVGHIKEKGNEANHEIILMDQPDAEELLVFLEALLKFIYEYPNRVKTKAAT
jgi:hypothetical protein